MMFIESSLWQSLRCNFRAQQCATVAGYFHLPRSQKYRFYATKTPHHSDAQEVTKQKPKAATQLRRTAAASLPIRSNPNPSRGEIRPVSVITTAERFLFPQIRFRLPASAVKLQSAVWVPRWSGQEGKDGEIFVFENGSLVCWGLEENDALKFARDFITGSIAEVGHLSEPETDDVEFVTDPNEKTRIQGDLIILGQSAPPEEPTSLPTSVPEMALPKDTLLARYAFSQGLARSSALSVLESKLDSFLLSVAALPVTLSKTGKVGLRRKEVIMKLGELMIFRQGINLNHENFLDTPDFYWAEPQLEAYFKSISDALDIRSRTHSLNSKITYAAEVQSVLRDLLTESSAHRMELIIILLISVEVVIVLIREGPDLWHILVGRKRANETKQEGQY